MVCDLRLKGILALLRGASRYIEIISTYKSTPNSGEIIAVPTEDSGRQHHQAITNNEGFCKFWPPMISYLLKLSLKPLF